MPTYEFRCPSGHDFEKFYRSIGTAPSEVHCPTCGKVAIRQMSAGGGLVFKGSGFYITDYGKDGKKSQTPPVKAAEGATARTTAEAAASTSDSSSGSEASPAKSKPPAGESKAAGESKPATPAPAKKPKSGE
jgi:putative FmdB family regulatory protein